ncbi:hypothetical protein C440_05103 [Haloferax mucosum ATCC BAA-1512]|uniref:Uncharacterized protein n=1 Tax=Haloferax mucosum ATCC BAA-1512 TaxID=662479 RepID=M0IKY8_9EURY|nr:hypothetical protein [Haloferax mucosum]ELZ96498.1 hypothetical protein C440_05103 [Haloferax mucosum ATCC BAA-1512]
MRKRTSHSDSIVSETRYDAILVALPVPLFLGVAVGMLTGHPLSLTAGAGGFASALVLAYGLFVAAPTTPRSAAPKRTDVPLDSRVAHTRDDTGRNRRRGSV